MSVVTNQVLIVGTGFAGLGMGIRLKQAGIHDFTILEQAGGVGGTWRDNHYPGAACDVPSHLYSFSFEPNPRWSRSFARAGGDPRVPRSLRRQVRPAAAHPLRHGRRPRATFDERTGLWTVETSDGQTLRARGARVGVRRAQPPVVPGHPGARARSRVRRSTRRGGTTPIRSRGRRVGVIGTGASAIQIVPARSRRRSGS